MQKLARAGQLASHAASSYAKGHQQGQAWGGHIIKGAEFAHHGLEALSMHNAAADSRVVSAHLPPRLVAAGRGYDNAMAPQRQAAIRARDTQTASQRHDAQEFADEVKYRSQREMARGNVAARKQKQAMQGLRQTNETLKQRANRKLPPSYIHGDQSPMPEPLPQAERDAAWQSFQGKRKVVNKALRETGGQTFPKPRGHKD